MRLIDARLIFSAVAVGLAAILGSLWANGTAAAAPPAGLAVSVQKDAADAPLYALVSWDAPSAAGIYEVQNASIRSATQERSWRTIPSSAIVFEESRANLRDAYEVGSGAACYRVRSIAPEASDFSSEACSPIPPKSSVPGPPNTGNYTRGHPGNSMDAGAMGALLLVSALGVSGWTIARKR